MKLAKILCATDFSDGARQALLVAASLARQTGAELVVVHAWALPAASIEGAGLSPKMIETMITESEQGLQEAANLARILDVARVSTKLLKGPAWDAITRELEADPTYDLAVVGTYGRTGLSRLLLGSVAERVVRHAPCSVLVVRLGNRVAPFDHILCAIDFSDSSRHAAEIAASFAQLGGRSLSLVHSLEVPVFPGEAFPPDTVGELDRRATMHLEELATMLRDRVQVPVTTHLLSGQPGTQVVAMLDGDPSYDLVVVGSHGRTGIRRLLLGSVAERIIRHAKVPVFVARRRGN